MAMEMRQSLKLSQQLVMTPQLQQAIKLLQLSRMELVDVVRQEMEENFLLEEAELSEGNKQEQRDPSEAGQNVSVDMSMEGIDSERRLDHGSDSEIVHEVKNEAGPVNEID